MVSGIEEKMREAAASSNASAPKAVNVEPSKENLNRRSPGAGLMSAVPLLAGISEAAVESILAQAGTLHVARKVHICTAGERAGYLFVLLKGRVKYSRPSEKGNEILLRVLTPGESFGLGSFLPTPPDYLGTAEAVSACELVVWKHTQIQQLVASHQQLAINALGIVMRYLGMLSDRHSDLFERDASQRIARALIDLGRRDGLLRPDGIDVHVSNEQLGALADVSRCTASRVLSNWNRTGFITKTREEVLIHSPENLLHI
jgi:CRP/FNR family transcriptional regulator, nitrogen oxide reductase regulator